MTITTITILTRAGAPYTLPNVVEEAFRAVIVPLLECPGSLETISIANMDKAVLSVPFAAIRQVLIGDQKVWSCSA
jgi:hypothetical protein